MTRYKSTKQILRHIFSSVLIIVVYPIFSSGSFRSSNLDYQTAQKESFPFKEIVGVDSVIISVKAGWNLISLPLVPATPYLYDIFPGTQSPAYRYENGYHSEDSLHAGVGYWIKFKTGSNFWIVGDFSEEYSINLSSGWNLIGSYRDTLLISEMFIQPFNVTISPFYSFDQDSGYVSPNYFSPGKGYWIKSGGAGVLIHDSTGMAWTLTSDHFADTYVIDTARPNFIYSGTRSIFPDIWGELFKSTDRGKTWDTLLSFLDVSNIRIDPIDSNIIYVSVSSANCGPPGLRPGILKTTDGGSSWAYADSGIFITCDTSPFVEIIDWSSPNNIYAVSGQILPGNLHRSLNSGQSWTIPFDQDSLDCNVDYRCALGMVPGLIQNRVNPDIIYAIVDFGLGPDQYLLRGSNLGTMWSYQGPIPQGPYADVAVHPMNGSVLYSGGSGFYKSTNEGVNWVEFSSGLPDTVYVGSVSPLKNSSSIFVIGQSGLNVDIYRSDDTGNNWFNLPFGYDSLRHIQIEQRNMFLYAEAGGKLYRRRIP